MADQVSFLTGMPSENIAYDLNARENQGSTYLTNGFVFPHIFIPESFHECCIIMVLEKPICYNRMDSTYADIFFGLFLHESNITQEYKLLDELCTYLVDLNKIKHIHNIKNIQSQVFNAYKNYFTAFEKEKNIS